MAFTSQNQQLGMKMWKFAKMLIKLTKIKKYPTELNKKILEDLQLKKQLLQKGGSPVAITTTSPTAALTIPQYMQATVNPQQPDLQVNSTSKAIWTQASNQSFGYFIPQDSLFGNSIIPVLPRHDNHTTAK